jgi:hypothetical protein
MAEHPPVWRDPNKQLIFDIATGHGKSGHVKSVVIADATTMERLRISEGAPISGSSEA